MKGFTLVELLGVLIILAVIALITLPIVSMSIKNGKEKLYNSQIEEIKLAAEKWAYKNINLLPTKDGETITVTLLSLKQSGDIPLDTRDPRTGELIPNDLIITIMFKNNNYIFAVDEESGSNITDEFNENAPTIILNGSHLEFVEINSDYNEKSAEAFSKNGNVLPVNITYQENNTEIGSIDTSKFTSYTAIYSATDNGYTTNITRIIIVRDTTSPNLVIPDNVNLTASQLSSFDVMDGVSVTDNSGEMIDIEVSGFDTKPSDKIIEYKACDSNNNCTVKRRIIKIITSISFAEDSWETIAKNIRSGNASVYNVGDTKEVTLTGDYAGTYTVRIANNSTPAECSTEGFSQTACGFVVEFVDIIVKYGMNSSMVNLGGWPASEMYDLVNTDIYNTLPTDLKNIIVDTFSVSGRGSDDSSNFPSTSVSGSGSTDMSNFTSTDKLYLLSPEEIWGNVEDPDNSKYKNFNSAISNSRQLDYYENLKINPYDNYSGAVKSYQGSADYWWLRTAYFDRSSNPSFYFVNESGDWNYSAANNSYGVAPAFRIG